MDMFPLIWIACGVAALFVGTGKDKKMGRYKERLLIAGGAVSLFICLLFRLGGDE